jgi:hypothetical protein
VLSRGDSAGFTVHPKYKEKGRQLKAIDTEARIFHYSNVKSTDALKEKTRVVQQLYSEKQIEGSNADYYRLLPRQFVDHYVGTHPQVMRGRVREHSAKLDLSSPYWRTRLTWKERKHWLRDRLFRRMNAMFSSGSSPKYVDK